MAEKPMEGAHEDRIDDFAVKSFQAMGYEGRLSDNMVLMYREFKARKDRLQPGRMSPEGLATVAVLAEMADGTLVLQRDAGPENPEE